MKNLSELNLSELSAYEIDRISGGDKFMRDLGYALGYAYSWFVDTLANADVSSVGHVDYR